MLTTILIVAGVLLVIYVAGALASAGKIFTSAFVETPELTADQYYYLPTAQVNITATVMIALTIKQSDSSFVSAELYQIDLTSTVQVLPDSKHLATITYHPSVFSNDELKLTTNASGLLENVDLKVEDRISNILSAVLEAPKQILGQERALVPTSRDLDPPEPVTVSNVTASRNFVLYPGDLQKGMTTKEWKVNLPGPAENPFPLVDASLHFTIRHPLIPAAAPAIKYFSGLYTRPLTSLGIDVSFVDPEKSGDNLHFELIVPDPTRLIMVPVRRSPFIKRQQTPKFTNGILIENYINKPSEVEGFVAIPVNIAKAIFSIPAQLLSFKITHTQQQTSLETETQKLLAAQVLSAKTKKDATTKPKNPKKPGI
jgi:hypothetical protein